MDDIILELNKLADTRLVGSRALGVHLNDSDIDVIMITEDISGTKDSLVNNYNAEVIRDDGKILRLITHLTSSDNVEYEVDITIVDPTDPIIGWRLEPINKYSSIITDTDIANIKHIKRWAIDHRIYDSHMGYLSGILIVEMYFHMRKDTREVNKFLRFYGNMSYNKFSHIARTEFGSIRFFINKYTWYTIREEMTKYKNRIRSFNEICKDYNQNWYANDKIEAIRSSIKYLPSSFGKEQIKGYRCIEEGNILYILLYMSGKDPITDSRTMMKRYIDSFAKYNMRVKIYPLIDCNHERVRS